MMTTLKQELNDTFQELISTANDEELHVLSSMLRGLNDKKEQKYATYLSALTQIQTRFLDNGDYEVVLPIQPLINNPLQMVHGGITATLLDTAMGSMINRILPEDKAAVTAEMNVHYIKPGVGSKLRCVAHLAHKGNSLCVTEAKVYDDREKLVAMATGTFALINRPHVK
ncbi:PaaI family thioesterase [Alkalihalophilus marmarensis]|jgi:uncharacterized protein (TIGR00369 family)|uniref:HGG motif-containing thioesterase n=1 Tax=Alkalihalophilus marmarensis DSM 21297 TaxID=1188261 RepID=U6SN86_9BACI|nr:PaaI family thioesterase [Alkalihalophilus marmarensis]ERN53073.1 HGG motif-containing thioesterase [Alkalihalophilus marmarensis DSM 21297]MCM3488884.1 PaaI family thioesterase [Alkalihalophilus marmarensis]